MKYFVIFIINWYKFGQRGHRPPNAGPKRKLEFDKRINCICHGNERKIVSSFGTHTRNAHTRHAVTTFPKSQTRRSLALTHTHTYRWHDSSISNNLNTIKMRICERAIRLHQNYFWVLYTRNTHSTGLGREWEMPWANRLTRHVQCSFYETCASVAIVGVCIELHTFSER